LAVYHGTKREFTVFDKSKNSNAYGSEKGFFFANREVAEMYGNGTLVQGFLNIKNPYQIDVIHELSQLDYDYLNEREEAEEAGYPIGRWLGEGNEVFEANDSATAYLDDNNEEIFDLAEEYGSDGVLVKGADGSIVTVAFNPNQIKSATNNNGNFDEESDDIRFQLGDRWDNSGYTEREDGTKVSVRALEAEENGTYTAGTFRKLYGVSVKDFDLLLKLGLIENTEWHHTGKSFRPSEYYSWTDSDRARGDVSYGDATKGWQGEATENSIAQKYKDNKKKFGDLVKAYEGKNWEYVEKKTARYVETFKSFADRMLQSIGLTEEENRERERQHDFISNRSGESSGYERMLMHGEVDKKYREILLKRRSEEMEKNRAELENQYNERYGEIIKRNEEIEKENAEADIKNKATQGKESVLLEIANMFDLPADEAYNTTKSVSSSEKRAEAYRREEEQKKAARQEAERQASEKRAKLNEWVNEQREKGNITDYSRVRTEPQHSYRQQSEMNGKYGWFNSAGKSYNMPEYYSGMQFSNKELLNEYRERQAEIESLESGYTEGLRFHISEEEEANLEAVNTAFNEELEKQIKGTLPKNHTYNLGTPLGILQSVGMPDYAIELQSSRLNAKSTQENHPFDLSEVKDLPKAIQNPLAIFAYGDKSKALNIITEIEHNGKKFLVGISMTPDADGEKLLVNSIRTVFPKDTREWVNWINQEKGLYFDKEKILNFLDQQQINSADVAFGLPENQVQQESLESAAKIIKNFDNPATPSEKNTEHVRFQIEQSQQELDNAEKEYTAADDDFLDKAQKVEDAKTLLELSEAIVEADRAKKIAEAKAEERFMKLNEAGIRLMADPKVQTFIRLHDIDPVINASKWSKITYNRIDAEKNTNNKHTQKR
jgi:hypothetical protein